MKKIYTEEEARVLGEAIGIDFSHVSLKEFIKGLGVEQEHGAHDPETDVTHDDDILIAKIAWAHLKEIPDYYTRLAVMEAEAQS